MGAASPLPHSRLQVLEHHAVWLEDLFKLSNSFDASINWRSEWCIFISSATQRIWETTKQERANIQWWVLRVSNIVARGASTNGRPATCRIVDIYMCTLVTILSNVVSRGGFTKGRPATCRIVDIYVCTLVTILCHINKINEPICRTVDWRMWSPPYVCTVHLAKQHGQNWFCNMSP
jgi:hypothetical protein